MMRLLKNLLIQSFGKSKPPRFATICKTDEFKRVKNGLGVAILSTSKGVMTDKEAKSQNVGGEVFCYIY